MELLNLFISFMKIGFTSMGGTTMIPIINSEMTAHGWMTTEEVADIVAIAEMTPGPVGLNCATFAGVRVAGVLGGIIASIGAMMPTFTLCFIVSLFFEKFNKSDIMQNVLYGVRPVAMALIVATICTLSVTVLWTGGGISLIGLFIAAVVCVLMWVFKLNIPTLILISAGLGVGLFTLFDKI